MQMCLATLFHNPQIGDPGSGGGGSGGSESEQRIKTKHTKILRKMKWRQRGGRQILGAQNLFCVFFKTFSTTEKLSLFSLSYICCSCALPICMAWVFVSHTTQIHKRFLHFACEKLRKLMEIDLSHFQIKSTMSKEPDNRASTLRIQEENAF